MSTAPQTADKPHGDVSRKVFARLFQKAVQSRAHSPCRRRNGEISLWRLLFAKLFLCACAAKEKAGYRLSICSIKLNMNFVINLTQKDFVRRIPPQSPFQYEVVLHGWRIALHLCQSQLTVPSPRIVIFIPYFDDISDSLSIIS